MQQFTDTTLALTKLSPHLLPHSAMLSQTHWTNHWTQSSANTSNNHNQQPPHCCQHNHQPCWWFHVFCWNATPSKQAYCSHLLQKLIPSWKNSSTSPQPEIHHLAPLLWTIPTVIWSPPTLQQLPHYCVTNNLKFLSLIPTSNLAGPTTIYLTEPLHSQPPTAALTELNQLTMRWLRSNSISHPAPQPSFESQPKKISLIRRSRGDHKCKWGYRSERKLKEFRNVGCGWL